MIISEEIRQLTNMVVNEINRIILIITSDNTVVLANTCATRQLGLKLGDKAEQVSKVFGCDLYGFVTGQAFNYQWQGQVEVRADVDFRKLYIKAKYVTGDKSVYNNLLLMGSFDEPPCVISVENSLGLSSDQFKKLYEISASLNSNLDFQSICRDITMKAAELVGADRSLLYSVRESQIGVFATWNMTEYEASLFRLVNMENGIIKNCLRHMAPVLVPAYEKHPDWIPEIYEGLNQFESFILFPLLAQKHLVGVLALFHKLPSYFDEKTLMLLQMISSQMAIAVLNGQIYSEISNLNKHLEEEVHLKVNELRVSELQLLRKSNEQEAILNSITDNLLVVNSSYQIIDINQAALGNYNINNTKQVLGKSYCDVICQRRFCRAGEKKCEQPFCREPGKYNPELSALEFLVKENSSPKLKETCLPTAKISGQRGDGCLLKETFLQAKPTSAEIDVDNRIFMISVYPIFDEKKAVSKAVCFLRDITLLKQRSSELVQGQKMQAVGQLAAGVAHEIRNPLGAISNYLYILENCLLDLESEGYQLEEDINKSLFSIRKLVERSEYVIRNLLDFSREKAQEITVFNLREVVDQILILTGKTAQKKKVEIVLEGGPNLNIKSDINAIQHILFNLVINAIDALPEGGQIKLVYALAAQELELSVKDNGEGIKAEDINKIYNPFYTTKAPNQGTGLGLYIVYNLVKQLNGHIKVESSPGCGTMFTVSLPQ